MCGSEPRSRRRNSSSCVPERRGGEDHAARAQAAAFAAAGSGDGLHEVAVGAVVGRERLHVDHARLGLHLRAQLFGEVQVVPVQRVLGVVAAADHAAAAADAGLARRSLAAEVRVGVAAAGR